MELYSSNDSYKLYKGDMRNMLDVIKKESIDAVLTDPPYELNFMGKGWDNSGIAFQKETWQKCYEVLKPGGYLLAFGGSRTFHRIACAIEDAGFEIRDTIMWLYGSGFPKSMDISKQIDKRNGKQNEDFTKFGNYVKQCREAKGYSKNDIDKIMGTNTACAWWEGRMYKDDFIVQLPDKENYYKLKEILDMNDDYDYLIEWQEAEREVIGQKKSSLGGTVAAGEKNEYFIKEHKNKIVDITIPSTELAKQWNGWGTALKPSFEPIIIARKPFKGSLVDNVIEYGVGGINIDECRVGNETTITKRNGNSGANGVYGKDDRKFERENPTGRFPANTILTYDETDFDEVCGGLPTSNKPNGSITKKYKMNNQVYGDYGYCNTWEAYQDSGSASRYFMNCKYTGKDEETRRYIYAPKASKKDRDEGCQDLEDTVNACSNQAIAELKRGNDTFSDETNSTFNKVYKGKNTHPTVKPTELMQYLVRLVSPNGATILDTFNGSGSTGKAVMYENRERNKNYKYIGIELTEEYLPIAKARIEYVCNLEPEKDIQMSIFDFIGDEKSEQ